MVVLAYKKVWSSAKYSLYSLSSKTGYLHEMRGGVRPTGTLARAKSRF